MIRPILFRPEAEAELLEAASWYEERSKGLGGDFLRALDGALAAIQRNPLAFPLVAESVHRAVLRRFPYSVMFVLMDDNILIIACFHGRRDPTVWGKRI